MIDRIIRSLGYVHATDFRKVELDVVSLNKRHQSHLGHVASLNRISAQTLDERDKFHAELEALKTTHAEAIAVRDREIARLSNGQKPRNPKKIAAALRQAQDSRGFAKQS